MAQGLRNLHVPQRQRHVPDRWMMCTFAVRCHLCSAAAWDAYYVAGLTGWTPDKGSEKNEAFRKQTKEPSLVSTGK